MGLFSRRRESIPHRRTPRPIDARSFGTWRWNGDMQCWIISFNNLLGQIIHMHLADFVESVGEIPSSGNFPNEPTDGMRIQISGMWGFGDDYRWYATVHGHDGRQYFFRVADRAISMRNGTSPDVRDSLEIELIPFESDDELPDLPTHRTEALVKEPDPSGLSEMPSVHIRDENTAAVLSHLADFASMDYDGLCSLLFGGAKSWQEKVIGELKRRKNTETLDSDALYEAVKRYKDQVEKRNSAKARQIAELIEAKLRKARGYGFDPPGGWGAMGPG